MSAVLVLHGQRERAKAHEWVNKAAPLSRVEFKGPTRSSDQNALMWALLTEIADQLPWHGRKLKPEDWKDLFTASLRRELRMVPNLNGDGFVLLGMRTSDMSRQEMGELIDMILAFGAEHGADLTNRGPDNTG